MPSDTETPASSGDEAGMRGLARLFALILLTQALVVAALYWFGRHFS